jgi:hypothetical protein
MSCTIERSNINPLKVEHKYCPNGFGSLSFSLNICRKPLVNPTNFTQNEWDDTAPLTIPTTLPPIRFGIAMQKYSNGGWVADDAYGANNTDPGYFITSPINPELTRLGKTKTTNSILPGVAIELIGVSNINAASNIWNFIYPNRNPGKYRLVLISDVIGKPCIDYFEYEIEDKSAINADVITEIIGGCENPKVSVTIKASGYKGNFKYLLAGAVNQSSSVIDTYFNTTSLGTVEEDTNNDVVYQVKTTSNFIIADSGDVNDLPINASINTGNPLFVYDVWIKQDNCPPVKLEPVNTNIASKPTYVVNIKPGTFSCDQSNCDGNIHVKVEGGSNSFAPYVVHARPVSVDTTSTETLSIKQRSKKVKAVSSTCDESCGFAVNIPICALEDGVLGNNEKYRWEVQVFDRFGCPLKFNNTPTLHFPTNNPGTGGNTTIYRAEAVSINPDTLTNPNDNQKHVPAFEPSDLNQIARIEAKATISECSSCCDSFIEEMYYYNKYNQLIIAEKIDSNGVVKYKTSLTETWADVDSNVYTSLNSAQKIKMCGVDYVNSGVDNFPYNGMFLLKVIEAPVNYKNVGAINLRAIRIGGTVNSNPSSFLKSAFNNNVFKNLCEGYYCFELSIALKQNVDIVPNSIPDNAGAIPHYYTRECECAIQFCVNVSCPKPLKVIQSN